MSNTTYNGWTNYATWRVNLEIFDGSDWHTKYDEWPDSYALSVAMREWAEEFITESSPEGLARDYALAFLSDVNWREIAKHMIEAYAEEA